MEFNVSVTNEGSSVASGQLTITVLDNSRVPIEYLQSQVFSVNPGQLETVQVVSDIVPTYAFVGIATAQVAIQDPSTGFPLFFENVNYYIGSTS